jgi:hypothetical protein
MRTTLVGVLGAASVAFAQADAPRGETRRAEPEVGKYEPSAAPSPVPEAAKIEHWYDRIKLSGKTFLRYSWDFSSSRNFNEFAIDRIYLQSEYQISDRFRVQVTLEAGDIRTSGTENFQVAPKFAFLEWKEADWAGFYVRAGMVHTAWIPYEEDVWGLRVQGPIFLDRGGYGSASDLGIAIGGQLPSKFGSYQVALVNGETWKKKEIGKGKDVMGRLTVKPLAFMGGVAGDLFLSGFFDYARVDNSPSSVEIKTRYVGQLGIATHDCVLAVDYLATFDPADPLNAKKYLVGPLGGVARGSGFSIFGVLGFRLFTEGWLGDLQVFARFDLLDPDVSVDDNNVQTLIAGVAYRVNKYITGLVDYEQVNYGLATRIADERRMKVQIEARF